MGFRKETTIAAKAALAGGKFLLQRLGKVASIGTKDTRYQLVTEVDRNSEEIIKQTIGRSFPKDAFLGEESGATGKSERTWIIDPLDGTTNFVHSYPAFCASVAFYKGGKAVAGAVYSPLHKELFLAEAGSGAYVNGKPIRPSKNAQLADCILSSGFPLHNKRLTAYNLKCLQAVLTKVQGFRRAGAAALEMCWVACGRLDGHWELDLKPWDTAAGSLILKEAGGTITRMDGSAWDVRALDMCATNGKVHDELVGVLRSVK
ncbi:MAG: inositol monophosphatase [Candidatus Aenigmarchaeota archaeon]|nr:inositol monophosphatase [Candidatus Aenigmarchaeota archaeon]